MQTFRFWKTEFHNPFDSFINDLREKAATSNFSDANRMIRDKVVFSICDKLQQMLLREDDMTLEKAIQVCQAYEMSNNSVKELQRSNTSVNKVNSTVTGKPNTFGLSENKRHLRPTNKIDTDYTDN